MTFFPKGIGYWNLALSLIQRRGGPGQRTASHECHPSQSGVLFVNRLPYSIKRYHEPRHLDLISRRYWQRKLLIARTSLWHTTGKPLKIDMKKWVCLLFTVCYRSKRYLNVNGWKTFRYYWQLWYSLHFYASKFERFIYGTLDDYMINLCESFTLSYSTIMSLLGGWYWSCTFTDGSICARRRPEFFERWLFDAYLLVFNMETDCWNWKRCVFKYNSTYNYTFILSYYLKKIRYFVGK